MSPVNQLPPAAYSCPQAASSLGDGGSAGQTEAPQWLPDTRQHPCLCWLPQVLMGNVVYSSQLFAVVVSQVTELLDCSLRYDGGLGWRAGHSVRGGLTTWGGRGNPCCCSSTGFPPHSLRGGGFAFGTSFNWMRWCFLIITVIYNVNFNINLNCMLRHDGSPLIHLFLPMSVCQLFFCSLCPFVCLSGCFQVLFSG